MNLGKQAINRAELIAEFVQTHKDGSFDNAKAKDMAKRWFKSQRADSTCWRNTTARSRKPSLPSRPGSFSRSRISSAFSST